MKPNLLALVVALLASPATLAQSAPPQPAQAVYGAPAELKRIAPMVGDWNVSTELATAPGQPAAKLKTTSRILPILGGAHLQETISVPLLNGSSVAMIGLWSYDRFRKTYRMAYLDERDALFDVKEGNWEGDRLVLTNVKSGTTLPMGGKQAHSRIVIHSLTAHRFLLEFAMSTDAGQTWIHQLTATYARK